MKTVFLVTWTESERGWGTRPDGCTIHASKEDYDKYVKSYWARMPKETPDEYSRPDNNINEVDVSDAIYEKMVNEGENGLAIWQGQFREYRNSGEIKI